MMNLTTRNGRTQWPNNGFAFDSSAIDQMLAGALDIPAWGANNVRELDDRAEISLDVPGVKPAQIEVTAEHRTLTVKVTSEERGSFTRQYTIGAKYDLGEIQARLELGVLTLSIAKAPEAQPRQIQVAVQAA